MNLEFRGMASLRPDPIGRLLKVRQPIFGWLYLRKLSMLIIK
jgi:hypothetical protein